ncbi:MAG: DUF4112 domain-containing protein [Desulfosarcina sp.]
MTQPHPDRLHEPTMKRVNRLAWLLDNSIRIPGTRYHIGLDPLIGLVPGIGDAAGALLSLTILWEAYRAKLPAPILARMGFNLVLEVIVGVVPVIGDLFDMTWKANARNARLMQKTIASPRKTVASSTVLMIVIVTIFILLVGASTYAGFMILRGVWNEVAV